MKTSKTLLLPLMLILSVFLLAVVSASSITVSLFYDTTADNSLIITNGEEATIILSADSIFEDSMTIKLDLLNSAGNVVSNILDTYTVSDSYSKSITIGQSTYSNAGDYTLKATVTAASGQTETDTLSLKVITSVPANSLPVITSTPITSINEGQSYSYQITATDSDGDSLTYSLTQNTAWLSINSQTGRITGTAPQVNADTSYAVTVRVSDGKGFVTQNFVITVKDVPIIPPVNSAPVIISTPFVTQMYEGNAYTYQVIATDADGDILTYSLTQNPSWLSINNAGLISGLTPQVNSDTSYSITIRVSDGKGGIATQSYTFTVKNDPYQGNHVPVITSTPITSINEGQSYSYQITATDSDGDSLTYSLTQNPAWLSINSQTGRITGIAPNVNSDTTYSVTLSIFDGKNGVATQSFTINVKNVIPINHLPVITSTPVTSVNEGQNYIYQVTATDPENDALTYSLRSSPSWLTVSNTGLISGTAPQVNSDTSSLVMVIVGDGKDSVAQLFTLTIRNVPSPPTDTTAPVITIISPVNGQTHTSSVVQLEMTTNENVTSAWYILDNGGISYINRAPSSYSHFIDSISVGDGTHNIVFYARDAAGNLGQSTTITFYVDTSSPPPTNSLPVITSTPITSINEGQSYSYQITATDSDGDSLTYSLTQNTAWLSINSQTGRITGIAPQVNADTSYAVTVRVSDGKGITTQSYTLTVRNVPSTPGGNGGGGNGGQTNKKAGIKYLSDAKGTEDYLAQFNSKTTVEEEEILGVEDQPRLLSSTLWIWLLVVGILIFITALIILWIRR